MITWGRLPGKPGRLSREPGAVDGLCRIVEKAQVVLARYERLSTLAEDDQVRDMVDRLAKEKRAQLALLRDYLGQWHPDPDGEPKKRVVGAMPVASEAIRPGTLAIGRDCAYRLVVWVEMRLWIVCIETALFGYNQSSREIAVNLAKDQKRVLETAGRLARQMGVDEAALCPSDGVVNEAAEKPADDSEERPAA